jgi:hypothetical protein
LIQELSDEPGGFEPGALKDRLESGLQAAAEGLNQAVEPGGEALAVFEAGRDEQGEGLEVFESDAALRAPTLAGDQAGAKEQVDVVVAQGQS